MKRDMDLVRNLLLFLEGRNSDTHVEPGDYPADGVDQFTVQYHLTLMYQAGLISGEPTRSTTSDRIISVLPFGLTWQGHEFLDSVRDPQIWRAAKAGASKAGSVSLEFIWTIAKGIATSEIRKLGFEV